MAYGYPFLTRDRKVHERHERRLRAMFPDAEFAWNNKQGRWEIVQPVNSKGGVRWSRVMMLGSEISESDFTHLRRVRAIHQGDEVVSQKDEEREAARRKLASDRDAALEEAGKRMFPIVMGALGIPCKTGMIPVAGTRQAKANMAGFQRRSSGLVVPTSAGV